MPFDGAGKTLVATQSLIVLGMIEAFFEGGARWARRTYCTADGKRCLLGAIEHVRDETGLVDNRATEYLAGAINLRQLSKGLPPLGDTATMTVIGFNDAFRRGYAEVVEILSEAKNLALSDTGVVAGEGQSECSSREPTTIIMVGCQSKSRAVSRRCLRAGGAFHHLGNLGSAPAEKTSITARLCIDVP